MFSLALLTLGLSSPAALAATPAYPVTLSGGLSFVAGPGAEGSGASLGGMGTGRLILHWGRVSLDMAGGEGYLTGFGREVGTIFVGPRFYLPANLTVRGGFFHAHEVPWAIFAGNFGAAVAGVHEDINHRSGAQVGLGVDWGWDSLIDDGPYQRVRSGFELAVGVLPDGRGAPVYVGLEFNSAINAGKRREPAP